MSGDYAFNCDGFSIALHCSLSIQRFYERAGNIVNDIIKFWYDAFAAAPPCLYIPHTVAVHQKPDVNYDVEICT